MTVTKVGHSHLDIIPEALLTYKEVPLNTSNSTTEPVAVKNDSGKPDLSLIPYIAEVKLAEALMVGLKKYGRYNYCKGMEASRLVAAAKRHLSKWFNGEDLDQEDGQHHLGSVLACVAIILRQQELGTLKDDRYKK